MKYLRAGFALADDRQRERLRWLVQGCATYVLGVLWISAIFLAIIVVRPEWREGTELIGSTLYEIVAGVAASFIAMSVFYSGALDPRTTLRRTTSFGLVGLALLAVFVAAGAGVGLLLVSSLGLPEQSQGWVATASVVVLQGPLRKTVDRRVDGILDWLLPPTGLIQDDRHHAVIVFSDHRRVYTPVLARGIEGADARRALSPDRTSKR